MAESSAIRDDIKEKIYKNIFMLQEGEWERFSWHEKMDKLSKLANHQGQGIEDLIDIASEDNSSIEEAREKGGYPEAIRALKKLNVGERAQIFREALMRCDLVDFIVIQRLDRKPELLCRFKGERIVFDPERPVKCIMSYLCPQIYSREVKNVLLDYLEASAETVDDEMVDPYHILPLRNGILDLNSLELRKYSESTYYFRGFEDVSVDPDVLARIIDGSYEIESNTIYKLWRNHFDQINWMRLTHVIGTWLSPFPLKVIAFLTGPPNCGKTSLVNASASPIEGRVARIPLSQIQSYTFALEGLIGKWIEIYTEKGATALRNVAVLNMLSGETERFDVARKNKPYARWRALKCQLYGMNDIPPIEKWDPETIDALLSRLVIIDMVIPEGFVPMPNIVNEIEKEEALYFLLYYRRLLELNNWRIEGKQDEDELRMILHERTWMLRKFAEDCLVEKQGDMLDLRIAYDVYLAWCRENYIVRPMGRNTFYDEMASRYTRTKGHARKWYFRDVNLSQHGRELIGEKGTADLASEY